MDDKADLKKIFSTALFGVAEDLATAHDKGQKLPGLLDKLGALASQAKKQGQDMVQIELKNKFHEYLPWIIVFVLVLTIGGIFAYKNTK